MGVECQLFQKKALRRCKFQRYLALRGGGWGGPVSRRNALGPFHGIRFVSDRTFAAFFSIIDIILGNYQQV